MAILAAAETALLRSLSSRTSPLPLGDDIIGGICQEQTFGVADLNDRLWSLAVAPLGSEQRQLSRSPFKKRSGRNPPHSRPQVEESRPAAFGI